MASETIRACLLRQARELRERLSNRIAAVTATYLEYEADHMDSEADQPCTVGHLCINGVRHCLASRRRIVASRVAGGQTSAATGWSVAVAIDC
jgi:hypothetical protein